MDFNQLLRELQPAPASTGAAVPSSSSHPAAEAAPVKAKGFAPWQPDLEAIAARKARTAKKAERRQQQNHPGKRKNSGDAHNAISSSDSDEGRGQGTAASALAQAALAKAAGQRARIAYRALTFVLRESHVRRKLPTDPPAISSWNAQLRSHLAACVRLEQNMPVAAATSHLCPTLLESHRRRQGMMQATVTEERRFRVWWHDEAEGNALGTTVGSTTKAGYKVDVIATARPEAERRALEGLYGLSLAELHHPVRWIMEGLLTQGRERLAATRVATSGTSSAPVVMAAVAACTPLSGGKTIDQLLATSSDDD